ncbi:chemosensory receptor A [Elysia marginata]|uniref:Chemosensory receptor A n=1 Tax=Elysia marginata TaxID=1093978 RepID=A0AAV4J9M3_9GAST|nr:chemosensory receptor A [Elysia marginata]
MYNHTESGETSGIISDETFEFLGLFFKVIVNPALGATGFCSNFINVVIFIKIGLSDGVSQNFFILSVSDGLSSIIAFVNSVVYILQHTIFNGVERVELFIQTIYWACFYAVTFPQNVSIVTTVVIAVVRCCCVAMPFRVRYLLTASRQLAAILVSSGTAVAVLLFVFTPTKTVYVKNPQTNRLYAVFVGYRWGVYTVFTAITLYSSFIIVIVCVIILSVSLNRSMKFREISASGTAGAENDRRKDMRVVKTVVFVSVVFIICFSPPSVFSLLKVFVSGLSSQGRYRKESQLFLMVNEMFLLLNANVNIFIYILCNTRYQSKFRSLFFKTTTGSSENNKI